MVPARSVDRPDGKSGAYGAGMRPVTPWPRLSRAAPGTAEPANPAPPRVFSVQEQT